MPTDNILFSVFLIFTGAALIATLVLYTKQSLLVAYMLLGLVLGPYGTKLVDDAAIIKQIADIGILFLLFLIGLNLHPQKLLHMLRKAMMVTILSSVIFAAISFAIARLCGYGEIESIIIGGAMMFSSTIIGLKLLPTTVLHHRHMGEVMISVLLLQDVLAILMLFLITALGNANAGLSWEHLIVVIFSLPVLLLIGYLAYHYILMKLLAKYDHFHEYVFLLSIGWCLGMAELSALMKLTGEIGAFIAGVVLAANPISYYIAENLKPLRDFFLILFFFSIGASFNLAYLLEVLWPAILLSLAILTLKPFLFQLLLKNSGEEPHVAREVGVRLGQASEFSLLVAYLAAGTEYTLISQSASYLIQAATLLTFFVSSYWVVWSYSTPMSLTERMRKD